MIADDMGGQDTITCIMHQDDTSSTSSLRKSPYLGVYAYAITPRYTPRGGMTPSPTHDLNLTPRKEPLPPRLLPWRRSLDDVVAALQDVDLCGVRPWSGEGPYFLPQWRLELRA